MLWKWYERSTENRGFLVFRMERIPQKYGFVWRWYRDCVMKECSIYDSWRIIEIQHLWYLKMILCERNIMFVVFKGRRTLEKRSKQAKDGTKRTLCVLWSPDAGCLLALKFIEYRYLRFLNGYRYRCLWL